MMTSRKHVRLVKEELDFILNHPATQSSNLDNTFDTMWWMLTEVCENGYCETDSVCLYPCHPRFDEFKHLINIDGNVNILYSELFGKEWEFDHGEYWYELDIAIYTAKSDVDFSDNYSHIRRIEGGAESWERMILEIASELRERFGDFNIDDDFFNKEEKDDKKKSDAYIAEMMDTICADGKFEKPPPKTKIPSKVVIKKRWQKWLKQNKPEEFESISFLLPEDER